VNDESRNVSADRFAASADDGPVVVPVTSERDPYEMLDDLMTVIEALCPTWPRREPMTEGGKFLL